MIDKYTMSYHIVILPKYIIYSCLTKARECLHFEKDLDIDNEYKNNPIDCFFNLYDEEGQLLLSAHQQTLYSSLKAVINTVPLMMLKDYIKGYSDNSKT